MTFYLQPGKNVNLIEDLRTKVKAAGFTMKAVCDRAGVSSGTPSHWAAGRTTPNQRTYDKLTAALRDMVAERDAKIRKSGLV